MQIKEQQHDRRGLPLVETTLQDLRYGLRALRRNPAYSLVGDCDAGHRHRRRHGGLQHRQRGPAAAAALRRSGAPRPGVRDQPAQELDAQHRVAGQLRRLEVAEHGLHGHRRLRAVQLQRQRRERDLPDRPGRAAGAEGARRHRQPVHRARRAAAARAARSPTRRPSRARRASSILSHGLWQSAFGGDPGIIGRAITLSGRAYDVVGVMPREFFFPGRDVQSLAAGRLPAVGVRAIAPAALARRRRRGSSRACRSSARSRRWTQIARGLEKQYPDTNTQMGVRLERFHDSLAYAPRPALLMLSGAVGLLFLIVCANIANLQLGRATARVRELAIRRALGAGRRRLVRQLLTESLIVSAIGGVLGFGIAIARPSGGAAIRGVGGAAVRRDPAGPVRGAVLRGAVAPRAAHLRCAAGADVVEAWPAGRARRSGVARHAVPPQHADRRRGRVVDRARRRRRPARRAACFACRRSIPGSIRTTS